MKNLQIKPLANKEVKEDKEDYGPKFTAHHAPHSRAACLLSALSDSADTGERKQEEERAESVQKMIMNFFRVP